MESKNPKIWRLTDILQWSKEYLKEKGVESPQIEAEWLLRHVLKYSRLEIYLNHNQIIDKKERIQFKKILLERASGIPIQYVLGYTEFMGYKIKVSPDTLIPRADTEVIVDHIFENYDNSKKLKILDLCTGSGCIAIALAMNFPNSTTSAIDISRSALKIALANINFYKLGDRLNLIHQDIIQNQNLPGKYDIIISNPPYISGDLYEKLDPLVKDNEPFIALNPGIDELIFYKKIAEIAKIHLTREGKLYVEIGGGYQVSAINKIFIEKGLKNLEIIKDYIKISRGIIATG